MRSQFLGICAVAALGVAVLGNTTQPGGQSPTVAVEKGIRWLVSVQGRDGGWGHDGGETSYVRTAERLETNGNDLANTAVAVQALLRTGNTPTRGEHRLAVERAVQFMLRHVEDSPEDGLAVTRVTGTQIQRKLGPYIDTFLTSMVLTEVDGKMADAQTNRRVRAALEKCVRKIERNQQQDGSWNISGGWAPILGTSIASRSLYAAQQKGVRVEPKVLDRVDRYTRVNAAPTGGAAAAGVPLYQSAQALEQLSRTSADRAENATAIRSITKELSNQKFVTGYGSMGGEEFFSYLNISDSLRRSGGEEWTKWNGQIKSRLVTLQNNDGTWVGHHCITGRVAVTSAAVLTLLVDREPVVKR